MTEEIETKPAIKRPRKMAREPVTEPNGAAAPTKSEDADSPASRATNAQKPPSKAAQVLGLLQRPQGATLEELVAATGWLPHSTRAALTGLSKKGHAIAKDKVDGVTRYMIAPVPAE